MYSAATVTEATYTQTYWRGGYADVQLCTVAFFAPQDLQSPLCVDKVVLITRCLVTFAFSLRIGYRKTVKFVLKFIDRRVKQKIWFQHGLQIWFICGFAYGW